MRSCPLLLGSMVTATPALAIASDHVEVVVTEHQALEPGGRLPGTTAPPGAADTTRTVQVIERGEPSSRGTTWVALSVGAVTMPLSRRGAIPPGDRLAADPLHGCVDGGSQRMCSAVRGADVRLQIFATPGTWHYPRVIGYVRSGYEVGEARLASSRSGGPHRGDATAVSYRSVPIFAGVSVYAFERFPVRPFAGIGMGVDVLQLRYARHEQAARVDVSPRFGFELHAGIEARIGNYVALSVELQQQWSVRRRLDHVPDFANTRMAVVTGLAVAVPYGSYARREHHVQRVTSSTRVVEPARVHGPVDRPSVGAPTTAPVFPAVPARPRTVIIEAPSGPATPPTAVVEPTPPG